MEHEPLLGMIEKMVKPWFGERICEMVIAEGGIAIFAWQDLVMLTATICVTWTARTISIDCPVVTFTQTMVSSKLMQLHTQSLHMHQCAATPSECMCSLCLQFWLP